ncbi:MAG TPA: methylated-DNA--[protein]-cysteine S-methyltransferase [Tepidisphaeraceae bacterium]|nr:methylated-DNA--[protein]-cysteine S-methyltransferase [Tepidisphaeraceae bacterium]
MPMRTMLEGTLPSVRVMLRAFRQKDASYDGTFFVAVKTTGVFCRPICGARPARPQNLEFFSSAEQAMRTGYRPCKRCRPLDPAALTPLAERLTRLIASTEAQPIRDRDLLGLGISPATARRQFLRKYGMTFSAYQRARRLAAALPGLRNGASVVQGQIQAGFESSSGFRAAFQRLFDAPASRSASLVLLTAAWIDTPLGTMLAVTHDQGIVMLEFADGSAAVERSVLRVRRAFSGARGRLATIVPAEHPHLQTLASELREYFAAGRQSFSVPLCPRGTSFQQRAWNYLRSIPYAQTRSYRDQAAAIGAPAAVRAVGRANGANPIAILIPCHRVIAADGSLGGYGGGLARKQWLLAHERRHLPRPSS